MSFEGELRRFYQRNWKSDIATLNHELASSGSTSAGLVETPPSIITGDPFALEAGRCILVLGINPGWRAGRVAEIDAGPAQAAWDEGFGAYRKHRSSYFNETLMPSRKTTKPDRRYSAHFSRLGNNIAIALGLAQIGGNAGSSARRLFRNRAAIFDLIPYWSTDTKKIDFKKFDPTTHTCLIEWHRVIDKFITEKKPVAVVINNSGNIDLVAGVLNVNFRSDISNGFYIGNRNDNCNTPVIAHRFLSQWRGIKNEDYIARFRIAAKQVELSIPASALAY